MNTLNFLDANVWLALLWSRHIHSERARSWFEQAGQEQFLFGRFTHITVLRLLTSEQIMGVDTKSMAGACGAGSGLVIGLFLCPSRRISRRSSARSLERPVALQRLGQKRTCWLSPPWQA